MKKGTILENLKISDIGFGGVGIAKIPTADGDFVVFVENTIPGQEVKARIIKSKKRYAEAKLVKVTKKSADEIELNYQRIPGAPFAAWPIEKQLEYKQKSTLEMFRRLGEVPEIENIFNAIQRCIFLCICDSLFNNINTDNFFNLRKRAQ